MSQNNTLHKFFLGIIIPEILFFYFLVPMIGWLKAYGILILFAILVGLISGILCRFYDNLRKRRRN